MEQKGLGKELVDKVERVEREIQMIKIQQEMKSMREELGRFSRPERNLSPSQSDERLYLYQSTQSESECDFWDVNQVRQSRVSEEASNKPIFYSHTEHCSVAGRRQHGKRPTRPPPAAPATTLIRPPS